MNDLQKRITDHMDRCGQYIRTTAVGTLPKEERDDIIDDICDSGLAYFSGLGMRGDIKITGNPYIHPTISAITNSLVNLQIAVSKAIAAHGLQESIDDLVAFRLEQLEMAYQAAKPPAMD